MMNFILNNQRLVVKDVFLCFSPLQARKKYEGGNRGYSHFSYFLARRRRENFWVPFEPKYGYGCPPPLFRARRARRGGTVSLISPDGSRFARCTQAPPTYLEMR